MLYKVQLATAVLHNAHTSACAFNAANGVTGLVFNTHYDTVCALETRGYLTATHELY
jgi:hypothetical protein